MFSRSAFSLDPFERCRVERANEGCMTIDNECAESPRRREGGTEACKSLAWLRTLAAAGLCSSAVKLAQSAQRCFASSPAAACLASKNAHVYSVGGMNLQVAEEGNVGEGKAREVEGGTRHGKTINFKCFSQLRTNRFNI